MQSCISVALRLRFWPVLVCWFCCKKEKSVLLLLKMNEMQNGGEEENEETGWRGRAMAGSCRPVPSEMKL